MKWILNLVNIQCHRCIFKLPPMSSGSSRYYWKLSFYASLCNINTRLQELWDTSLQIIRLTMQQLAHQSVRSPCTVSVWISWIRRTSVSTLWVWLWCFLSPQIVLLKFNVMVFGGVNYLIAQWLNLILIVILCFYALNVRGTSLFSLCFRRKAIMTWGWTFPFYLVSLAQRKPDNLFSLFSTAGLGENRVSLLISKSSLLYTENKI